MSGTASRVPGTNAHKNNSDTASLGQKLMITKGSRQKGESIEKMSDSEEGESLTSASSHDSPAGGSNAPSQDKAQRKALR